MATARKKASGGSGRPRKAAAEKPASKPSAKPAKAKPKAKAKAAKPKAKAKPKGKAKAPAKRSRRGPKGPRLTAAEQSIRDTLIVARKHQDWPWEAIAKEAGISVSATKKAYYNRRRAAESLLDEDPIAILRMLVEGLQLSIGDLEQLAVASMEDRNLAVAVGAKKAANDAREKLQELLQSVGVLPHELGTLRWHVEFKSVVVQLVDTVDNFVERIEGLKLKKADREAVVGAAVELRSGLETMGSTPQLNGGGSDG